MYFIQNCFVYNPSDSTVSEDAGIEPRTAATSALAVIGYISSAQIKPWASASLFPLYNQTAQDRNIYVFQIVHCFKIKPNSDIFHPINNCYQQHIRFCYAVVSLGPVPFPPQLTRCGSSPFSESYFSVCSRHLHIKSLPSIAGKGGGGGPTGRRLTPPFLYV
jgi:hypothetical protein